MMQDEQELQEIYRFGYKLLALQASNIAVAIVIGMIFSCLKEMALFLITYASLRSYAGGYHADGPVRCGIISAAIELAVAVILQTPLTAGMLPLLAVVVLCEIIICAAAPVPAKNKPLTDVQVISFRRKARMLLGAESALMAGCYFAGFRELSTVIALCHISVAGLLIAGKLKK